MTSHKDMGDASGPRAQAMGELVVGEVYRSLFNDNYLFKVTRIVGKGRARQVALSSRNLDGSTPIGGPVDHKVTMAVAKAILSPRTAPADTQKSGRAR